MSSVTTLWYSEKDPEDLDYCCMVEKIPRACAGQQHVLAASTLREGEKDHMDTSSNILIRILQKYPTNTYLLLILSKK